MSLRSKRQEKLDNSSCVVEGDWERRCSGMRNISCPLLLPRLRWPISGPPVPQTCFPPRHFGTTFQWFEQNCALFKNPSFQESKSDTDKKHKIFDGFGTNYVLAIFSRTQFLVWCRAFGFEPWKAHFALSSGNLHPHEEWQPHTHPLEPAKPRMALKTQIRF